MRAVFASAVGVWFQTLFFVLAFVIIININSAQASTAALTKGSYSYVGGKSKDISTNPGGFTSPSSPIHLQSSPVNALNGAASSLAATSYYEPRGDYGGGGGGGGGIGGGWGGGSGGHSVYQYSLQPQPYYHPAPMYYDDGGSDGLEKGLIGLLGLGGLSGLKGLLGLLGLLKLLLPLLGLLLPLLLPLLLLKALALLALVLLIPVPVITTGGAAIGGRKVPTTFAEGKTYLKETVTELLSKIPADMSQIISKIKDSSTTQSKEMAKSRDLKPIVKKSSTLVTSTSTSTDKPNSRPTKTKTR